MGFFKKLVKSATNPSQVFKDPKQALKNATAMGLDPAGSFVRMGTTGNAAPVNGRQMIDPSGKVLMPEQQAAPTGTYTRRPLTLSPAAQQLYDQMKARTAARAAARTSGQPVMGIGMGPSATPAAPTTPPITQPAASSPGFAPTPGGGVRQLLQTGVQQPNVAPPRPVMSGAGRYADGGRVKGRSKSSEDPCFNSKAFTRKPNGKPF